MEAKPLSPLETRCYAALQAFRERHDRDPLVSELACAAELKPSQARDALHRLVCKGWLETDQLDPVPQRTIQDVKREQPIASHFPARHRPVSDSIIRAIESARAAGVSASSLKEATGVQRGQVQQLLQTGQSLRLDTVDRLAKQFGLRLAKLGAADWPTADPPSEALRAAIAAAIGQGATLAAR